MYKLSDLMIEPAVRAALLEDLGHCGDRTSQLLVPEDLMWKGALRARKAGVIAGLDVARLAFSLMDSSLTFERKVAEGQWVEAGDTLAVIAGKAQAILGAERVALNFLSRLSGIATMTSRYVEAVAGTKARICCTRKTTPLLRVFEKYAVQAGGGFNHRMGLDDAVLIKDNHLAVCKDMGQAVAQLREQLGHMVKIEIEVDRLDQLREILDLPVDVIMLDNMPLSILRQAVELVAGRFVTEASGNVTLETAPEIAATGVDYISCGRLTHSVESLDIGLDEAA